MHLNHDPGATPYRVWWSVRRTWWQSLPPGLRGDCQLWAEWHQVGSLVTRETSRAAQLSPDPLIRTVRSWGLGQLCRSVRWVGCRWSRYWLSRGCTESRRIAILSGLTIEFTQSNAGYLDVLTIMNLISANLPHLMHNLYSSSKNVYIIIRNQFISENVIKLYLIYFLLIGTKLFIITIIFEMCRHEVV